MLEDGSRLATAGEDGTVALWDEQVRQLQQLKGPTRHIEVLSLSADRAWAAAGLTGASGDASGELRLWDVKSGEGRLLHTHQGEVTVMAFSPDGGQLVSGSDDHTLWVQPMESGEGRKLDMSGVGWLRAAPGLLPGRPALGDGALRWHGPPLGSAQR